MKLTLVTQFSDSPSTVLNRSILQRLRGFTYMKSLNDVDSNVDVILFMGYDPQVADARVRFPKAQIGIIDPRPGMKKDLDKADFWLANGVEMVNYFASLNPNAFIYPIYPALPSQQLGNYTSRKELIVAYHGNRDHLELMIDSVCPALEKLSSNFHITLNCIYNVKQLGEFSWKPKSENIRVNCIQWSEKAYIEHLKNSDIGIVPNFIPFKPDESGFDRTMKERNLSHEHDLKFRYKPTTNMGRILVFAQLGIPVISDMFPSATEVIRHGENGLLATDAASWFVHLNYLAKNATERRRMASNMYNVFRKEYHWDVMNKRLVTFLKKNKSRSVSVQPNLFQRFITSIK